MKTYNGIERLKNEYNDLYNNPITSLSISVGLIDDNNLYKWKFCLLGPKDTPYADGFFKLLLKFPNYYPEEKPEIIFLTPIYHLNVNPRKHEDEWSEPLGHVSVSFINWWKPETTPREILTRLYSIFYWQNPESPYSLERANEFKFNRSLFMKKACYFTKKYANIAIKQELYDKTWDFSCNENDLNSLSTPKIERKIIKSIKNDNVYKTLNFRLNDNGRRNINCHCNINYRINEILKVYNVRSDFASSELLCIYNGEKIDISLSLKDNGIQENGEIVIIYDVEYA